MEFSKRLRERVRRGEITCSVRIWMRPNVKAGNRYALTGGGEIEVDSIEQIALEDITPQLARESGFDGVVDLLKTAQHGKGSNVYLVRFHPVGGGAERARRAPAHTPPRAHATTTRKRGARSGRIRARVLAMLARLPEAAAVEHGTHLSLEVRAKRFGYFLDDHHGDGRIALNCKSTADVRDALEQLAPDAFHVPKYVGNRGWIGLWLDVGALDWSAVELALREAYALVAPKTVARARDARRPGAAQNRRRTAKASGRSR